MPTADQYAREYARRQRQQPARSNNYTVTRVGTTTGNQNTTRSSADQAERSRGYNGSTGYRSPYEGYADNQYRAGQNDVGPALDLGPSYASPGGGGGGGGGGYGGGGGGGGLTFEQQQAAAQNQMAFLMSLIQQGQYNVPTRTFTPDTAMYDRVRQGVAADRANAGTTYDQLDAYLTQMGQSPNAYEGISQQQGPQADLSMLNLLASQGGDTAAARAEADFLSQTGQNQANAFNRMAQMMASGETANRQSRGVESQQARAFTDREITAAELGLTTQLDAREQTRRQQIEDQNYQAQVASQQQRVQQYQQLAELAAQYGLPMPSMESLGITNPQSPQTPQAPQRVQRNGTPSGAGPSMRAPSVPADLAAIVGQLRPDGGAGGPSMRTAVQPDPTLGNTDLRPMARIRNQPKTTGRALR